jgi:pimeloyl-ACP methyl ester carboxylesterase
MTTVTTARLKRPAASIAYRCLGEGPPLLLLHATLSSSRQLRVLASRLAERHRVVAVDRRGSGDSAPAADMPSSPIDVAVHVADLAALIDSEGLGRCLVVGHSYGGCLALELAARQPDLIAAVWAYEPPYGPLAPLAAQQHMADVARRTLAANEQHGPAAAAEAFVAGVAGQAAIEALTPAARARIGRAGPGAVADAPLLGLDADGLARIVCPVAIATGGASQALYGAIADGLRNRIGGATVVPIPNVDHMAPLTRPDIIAAAVEAFADR